MKFSGELKFPEVDHPGVPVQFVVEGSQAELIVEGESLGRWSLFDVRAQRLVASAFEVDLDGTEVTFVADEPVDFAYRGVEHMAKTWASLKTKRIAARTIAVRKTRKGTIPSRLEDLRAAMESNLEAHQPTPLAGEGSMPQSQSPAPSPVQRLMAPSEQTLEVEESQVEKDAVPTPQEEAGADWDQRTEGSIPLISDGPPPTAEEPIAAPPSTLSPEERTLEEEKRRLAAERARLEEEKRQAEQREANLIEAYRLEMERLKAERAQLRAESPTGVDQPDADESDAETPGFVDLDDFETELTDTPAPEPEPEPEPKPAPELSREPAAQRPSPVTPPRADPEPEREPALSGAAREKGGLMGAVKSAFKTNPRDHHHQFIEAPGGLGITRNVCEECGYVSIASGD